jgi:hypothetical protein
MLAPLLVALVWLVPAVAPVPVVVVAVVLAL